MRIIIVGAGIIGTNLAQALTDEQHEVYLIEKNEERANKINEKLDVKVVVGDGGDPSILRSVGAAQADLVVSATASDETNLVVSSLAAAFGAKRRIARVRKNSLNKALADLGFEKFHVDELINPEQVAAQAIVKAIEAPGACEVADFANGRILLRAFDISEKSPLCGLKIEEVKNEDFPWPLLIIAIMRDSDVLIPKGNTSIKASDRIYVLLPSPSLGEFLTFVDPNIRKPKKVIIYGANSIGEQVAAELAEHIRDIVLIEENKDRAEAAAGRLKTARVINGSPSEADILKECGIESADAFIATSNSDHSNLISAVLAKKMGAKTTVITTHHPDYMAIVDALDIDVVINPRFLAADQIRRLVRGPGISSVTKLMECNAEALELVPEENSLVTKMPLKDLSFPKNSIVGAIYRGSEVILANGNTQIKAGEGVIVFCQETAVKKLQEMFTHKNFFKS